MKKTSKIIYFIIITLFLGHQGNPSDTNLSSSGKRLESKEEFCGFLEEVFNPNDHPLTQKNKESYDLVYYDYETEI